MTEQLDKSGVKRYVIKCEQCSKVFDDKELEVNLMNHLEVHERLAKLQLYFKRVKIE